MSKIYPFLLLIAVASFSSCNSRSEMLPPAEEEIVEAFDYGEVKDNVYTNNYFNCTMRVPANWDVQTQEQMREVEEIGRDAAGFDKKTMEMSAMITANLLSIFKYPIDSIAGEFNTSFFLVSEKNIAHCQNGKEYLELAQNTMDRSGMPYQYEKGIFDRRTSSGKDLYSFKAYMDVEGTTATQEFVAVIVKDYTLNIIMTYVDDQTRDELYAILNTLKFKD